MCLTHVVLKWLLPAAWPKPLPGMVHMPASSNNLLWSDTHTQTCHNGSSGCQHSAVSAVVMLVLVPHPQPAPVPPSGTACIIYWGTDH